MSIAFSVISFRPGWSTASVLSFFGEFLRPRRFFGYTWRSTHFACGQASTQRLADE
jgi:hypothetical protein